MTIREAGKGIVTTVGGTYRIGFINMDGQEDETELDAYNMTELEELYRDFVKRMDLDRIPSPIWTVNETQAPGNRRLPLIEKN